MKYMIVCNADSIEVYTDHTERVPSGTRYPPKTGIDYVYGELTCGIRCDWSVEGMVALMKWVRVIDNTVTAEDILLLRPHFTLSAADELRFYAELSEMGLSHLE